MWLPRRGLLRAAGSLLTLSATTVAGAAGVRARRSGSDPLWTFDTAEGFLNTVVTPERVYVLSSDSETLSVVDAADGTLRWEFQSPGGVFYLVEADGVAYVSAIDDSFHALDAQSGDELWRYGTAGTPRGPRLADGTAYLGDSAGNAYALDTADGTERWTRDLAPAETSVLVSALGTDLLHLGVDGERSHFVDPATGDDSWTVPLDGSAAFARRDGKTVYLANRESGLYAHDAADGSRRWAFTAAGGFPALGDGTLYLASRQGRDANFYAVDADDGSARWSFESPLDPSYGLLDDGAVYLRGRETGEGAVYALDAATGAERWRFEPGDEVVSHAVADGTVYAGSKDTHAYALDAATGAKRWRLDTGGAVWNVRVVDDRVYVGSNGGTVYAFDAAALARGTVRPTATATAAAGREGGSPPAPADGDGSGSDGGMALWPVTAGVIGLLGLGGAGAWLLSERGGSGGDRTDGTDAPTPAAGDTGDERARDDHRRADSDAGDAPSSAPHGDDPWARSEVRPVSEADDDHDGG
jgi:outer membrane protein assembly factor BamB